MSGAPRLGAVVLAAGGSTRAGSENKLLLRLGGRALVAGVVETALAGGLDPVVVVTGFEAARIRTLLSTHPIVPIHNPSWRRGLAGSLARGLAALPEGSAGAAILLGDMPWVTASHLRSLREAFGHCPGKICVPVHRGRRGNPVVWGADYFDELTTLTGDRGARGLLDRHARRVCPVEVDDPGVLRDIDTLEDWRTALEGAAPPGPE